MVAPELLRCGCASRLRGARRAEFLVRPQFPLLRRGMTGTLIPVNTRVFNGFILRRMRPAFCASGRSSGCDGTGHACVPRTRAIPRAALFRADPEQERRPCRSTHNNGRR
ncbi:hypothetical protein BconGalA64_17730 [Burkholderia contaminans]|nr:hypothetical protein BconGalA64_17730 [Burkholderia contaminans]